MTKLTHIKSLGNPNYIGSHNLQSDDEKYFDLTVEISKVDEEMVYNQRKEKEELVVVAHLVGHKPMIINKINQASLTALFKTSYVEKWVGKKYTIYALNTRYFGKAVRALRVRETTTIVDDIPAALPELTPASKPWAATIEALRSGKTTVEALKLVRIITDEDGATLMAAQIEGEVI